MSRYLFRSRLINASPMLLALLCGTMGILAAGPVCAQEAIPIQPVTVVVPSANFPTIQDAIDAVPQFSTITVLPGEYSGDGFWDLDLKGKNLKIKNASMLPSRFKCTLNLYEEGGHHRAFTLTSHQNQNTVISGFTIKKGNANPGAPGGAILSQGSSALIKHCVFDDNSADSGAAIYFEGGGGPVVENCTFKNNKGSGAITGYDPNGEGLNLTLTHVKVLNQTVSESQGIRVTSSESAVNKPEITIDKCTVDSNKGGGLLFENCASVSITRTFARFNTGVGALYTRNCSLLYVANCVFGKNTKGANIAQGTAIITDCTFYGNYEADGNTLATTIFAQDVTLWLVNSILWTPDNSPNWALNSYGGHVKVAYCAVRDQANELNGVHEQVANKLITEHPFVDYNNNTNDPTDNVRLKETATDVRGMATDEPVDNGVWLPRDDITGYLRDYYPKRDPGAYEYHD